MFSLSPETSNLSSEGGFKVLYTNLILFYNEQAKCIIEYKAKHVSK